MKESFYFIIPMALSGGIFMYLSQKYNWSGRLWNRLFKKRSIRNSILEIVIWLVAAVFIQLIVQILCEYAGMELPEVRIPVGVAFGLCMAFMPNLKQR